VLHFTLGSCTLADLHSPLPPWAWLWFARPLVLHCCRCRCVLVRWWVCHVALLHAPVGLVGFDVVQLWLLLSGCYAGWRWLAFAVLLPLFITLLPPFLLFCLSISSHLLHVASLVPPSTSCAAVDALLRPLSAGVVCFPLPGWTLH